MIVVLIRHAERDPSGSDALSTKGKKRAAMLVEMFRNAGVRAIFTSEFNRTKQTAAPLATALGIAPKEIALDPDTARAQILAAGGLAIVVGHSDTVPEFIGALGAQIISRSQTPSSIACSS